MSAKCVHAMDVEEDHGGFYRVVCVFCGLHTDWHPSRSYSVRAWKMITREVPA